MKHLHLAIALCAMTLVSTSHAQVPMQHWQGLAISAITAAEKGTVRDMVRAGHYYRTGFGVHRVVEQARRGEHRLDRRDVDDRRPTRQPGHRRPAEPATLLR